MTKPFNLSEEFQKCNDGISPIMGDITAVDKWRNVALKLGELLSNQGPTNYYAFTPEQWFEWAKLQIDNKIKVKYVAGDRIKPIPYDFEE